MAEDNRKRSLVDGDDRDIDDVLSSKRAALGTANGDNSSGDQDYLFKMLCPKDVAGSIIGRGGSIISALHETTGAWMKVSQNTDFFPMTSDRVIVISGKKESISAALNEVITRIMEVNVHFTFLISLRSFHNNLFSSTILYNYPI